MKKIATTLAILVIAISNINAQDKSAMTAAENVYNAMMEIKKANANGRLEATTELRRNPESNAVISSMEIIPFQSSSAVMADLIKKAQKAFEADRDKGYNYGNIQGGNYGTFKGEDSQSILEIMNETEQPAPHILYLEVKCADNPQMRTFYGLKWAHKEGAGTYGTLYLITSKRPDLIIAEKDKKADDADEEDVMSLLPTDAQNRLKVLGAMIDTYTDEMNTLQRNVDENFGIPTLRQSFIDQMNLLQKKRQELLDKVHQIILEETN